MLYRRHLARPEELELWFDKDKETGQGEVDIVDSVVGSRIVGQLVVGNAPDDFDMSLQSIIGNCPEKAIVVREPGAERLIDMLMEFGIDSDTAARETYGPDKAGIDADDPDSIMYAMHARDIAISRYDQGAAAVVLAIEITGALEAHRTGLHEHISLAYELGGNVSLWEDWQDDDQ